MSLDAARGLLACPHCAGDLLPSGARWACPHGHSFDVARPGYLNLTDAAEPANADTAAMLDARARVHAAGVFDALTEALDAAVPGHAVRMLEAGAGTAAHLAAVTGRRPDARGLAVDVSRAAARRAARAHPRVASVVADVWRGLPVRTGVLDAVLCVFAPRNAGEFARVLHPDGRLVVATPAPGHLAGLRARYGLLGLQDDKHARLAAALAGRFTPVGDTLVACSLDASAGLVRDLIGMGPNAFHDAPRVEHGQPVDLAVRVTTFSPLR